MAKVVVHRKRNNGGKPRKVRVKVKGKGKKK